MKKVLLDGRQLKAARVVLGLTVRDLADISGYHRNTILREESRKTLKTYAAAAENIAYHLMQRGIKFIVQDGKVGILFDAPTVRDPVKYRRKVPRA
jgi:transcriptional regulator with XRE-family HTH domain